MVDIIWRQCQKEAACQGEHSSQVSPTLCWQSAVPGTNPMFRSVGLLRGRQRGRATQGCFKEPPRVHGNGGIPSSSVQGRLCDKWKHFAGFWCKAQEEKNTLGRSGSASQTFVFIC